MAQVSRPVQVLFALTMAFAALWFVALRPKDGGGSSAPSPPPAAAAPNSPPAKSAIPGGLGSAVDKARAGAAQASADAASRPGRVEAHAGDPAAPAAAGAPVRAAGKPARSPAVARRLRHAGVSPVAVERALAAHRAVVLLFYAGGADDRAVRRELASVPRRGGRVVVASAPIAALSRFGAITRGVEVLEAPTVVVVGPSGRGRALPGYADHTEIDQAVGSALAGR